MILLLLALSASAETVEGRVLQRGDAAPVPEAELTGPTGMVPVDALGRFSLDLDEGTWTLLASSPDHAPQSIEVEVPLGKPLRIFLDPLPEGHEIVVESFRPTSDLSRHLVDAEMAYETPGTFDDAVRLVQSLPGVNVQREFAPGSGEVSVRGSLPGDNRYYLDGIEVPYLYHFNQYASVFPASQLSSLELFSSTFGVRYGDAVGAVIEARSDTTRPEGISGSASINLVTLGAELKVPLPKGWWVAAAGRRSFHDFFGETSAQYPLWPRFHDFVVRAEHEASNGSRTGFFVWGAGDRYQRALSELDVLDPVEGESTPRLDHRRGFEVAGVRHDWRQGQLVVGVVHDQSSTELTGGSGEKHQGVTLSSRLDSHGDIQPWMRWKAGWELRGGYDHLDAREGGAAAAAQASTEAPSLAWRRDVDDGLWRGRGSTYGELQLTHGAMRWMPGVRLGLDTAGWKVLLEPRLAARFRVADQTELTLGGGRYRQRPESWQLLLDDQLPTTHAWQIAAGVEQTVANRLEISLQGYWKWLDTPLVPVPWGPTLVTDVGQAAGFELTTRYRIREVFFLWGWFSYSRALARVDGGWVPTAADQPLSAGIVASWSITDAVTVAVRYRIASGLPYTGIDGSIYHATQDAWEPVYGSLNGERLPLYQKIDLHTAYTFRMPRWSLTLSADLWIVPPTSSQLYPVWSYDYREQGWVSGPPVLPLVGARATF